MSGANHYRPVPFHQVAIRDEFWAPKLRTNREVTIPTAYKQCQNTGRIDAFKQDWTPGKEPVPHVFWDSDVAKWIEAASYSLSDQNNPALEEQLDEVIALIASAQQPDGYLNTHFTPVEPDKRWTNLRDNHELYCAGHMMEAAVAHYEATGKRSLLDVACRYADYIGEVFGTGPNQLRGYCGHEEIELALVKLFRATGQDRYLQLSRYFIEERGQQPYYFDQEAIARGEGPGKYAFGSYAYMQAHRPVREQDRVVGHAVRAMYLYTALADLSVELDDNSLYEACDKLWHHLCAKHMYITGGIGASGANEGFMNDYDLPNETAYCETCAAIGLIYWNHRMLQKNGDSRFADVIERVLYNGAISGISQDGTRFFYGNPLAAFERTSPHGNRPHDPLYYGRSEWFGCACCPPNLARLLASLGEYVYSANETELLVHLYMEGEAKLAMNGRELNVNQQTKYPWDGEVRLRLDMEEAAAFAWKLRIPGWCRTYTLAVNGVSVKEEANVVNGYATLERLWHPGDEIILELHMPVERVYAHPMVRHNIGHVALQRGPVVYCIEQADHDVPVHTIRLPGDVKLTATFEPDMFSGVVVLRGDAVAAEERGWEGTLYRTEQPVYATCALTAIPYYAWANREPGEMRVWIPE